VEINNGTSLGTSTTVLNYAEWLPTDYGVGKPKLLIQKNATATQWNIGLWDTSSSAGTIGFTSNVSFAGTVVRGSSALYGRDDVLGTVSQSSGVPTGAVVERGSNANGEYVKFADGTLICTNTSVGSLDAATAVGSLFTAATPLTWTFPAAFATGTLPVVVAVPQSALRWGSCDASTTTSVSINNFRATSATGTTNVRAQATGRWF
jgi:hypothetical protein